MNGKTGRKSLMGHPSHPFPVGTEYYRAPMPPQELWEEDFAAIRASGMRILRIFTYWNWIEPRPGGYEFDDIDRVFELAEKNDLHVWVIHRREVISAGSDCFFQVTPAGLIPE